MELSSCLGFSAAGEALPRVAKLLLPPESRQLSDRTLPGREPAVLVHAADASATLSGTEGGSGSSSSSPSRARRLDSRPAIVADPGLPMPPPPVARGRLQPLEVVSEPIAAATTATSAAAVKS